MPESSTTESSKYLQILFPWLLAVVPMPDDLAQILSIVPRNILCISSNIRTKGR